MDGKDSSIANAEPKAGSASDESIPSTPINADEALGALKVVEESGLQLDPTSSKKIRQYADFVVLPILCLIYMVQFLDRTVLSYSSIMGLEEALHLKDQQYSWLGSIFFFGFLGAELYNGRLLQVLPVGKYLSVCVTVWGVLIATFSVIDTYAKGLGLRFLLGVLQAPTSPVIILVVSQWYTKSEQTIRTAVWVASSGLAQIIGGTVAYGLAIRIDDYSMDAWRITFILFGCMAVFVGLIAFFLLPDSQLNAPFLSSDLRNLAVERVRQNQQGIGNKKFKWYQFREVFTDSFCWAIFIFGIACNIPAGGITNFFSLIILSFGFTPEESLLYGCPAGGFSIVIIMAWGFISYKWGCRIIAGIASLGLVLIGVIMIIAIPESAPAARLIGYYLTMGIPAAEASAASLISTNVAGYTKKTTVCALFFLGYCVGNIIGPQTFRDKDAPDYRPAEIAIIALTAFCILDFGFMYWVLRRRNAEKARLRSQPNYQKRHGSEFWDLTDMENIEFEYAL